MRRVRWLLSRAPRCEARQCSSRVARCHGPEGKGNGPDSDHAIQLRTQVDDMPAVKDKLSKDQVWTLVEYLKVLRTPRR
jgi:mono/diheme cytochrome c family protein